MVTSNVAFTAKEEPDLTRVGECLWRHQSLIYYAIVRVGGKQIKRSLKTKDRIIAKNKLAHRFSFDLLDFNPETLAYAKRQIETITAGRTDAPQVSYILKTVQELLRQAIELPANAQTYDIIYCAGLFDYLSDRVCAKLVKLFYQWCEPGGRVLVTNVHSSNPVKGLMEHVMEWHLVMRDESDMLRLAPDPDSAKIYTDDTGINVFLEIEKPET